jgi:hypothetical protein
MVVVDTREGPKEDQRENTHVKGFPRSEKGQHTYTETGYHKWDAEHVESVQYLYFQLLNQQTVTLLPVGALTFD